MNQYTREGVTGYLRTDKRSMVNELGEKIILRGWGAGNWMNPEGFMATGIDGMYGFTPLDSQFHQNVRYDRGRTMHDSIKELCGMDYAEKFWIKWYENQLGEADIKAMADWGYNSVRLPLDAWGLLYEEPEIAFKEDSFAMITQVLDWCEKYGIYAILDLHAAPGGQSGVSCDNGIDNIPRMFLEPESRERALILWEELAKRYANRWIVAGYELLNEPISTPKWLYLRGELRRFYEEAIERIRKIDKKHMIILHGSSFAHDMELFEKGYDPECNNWCISVHMYDFVPEKKTIYKYLEPSVRLNVPLWIGEGGAKEADMAIFYDILGEMEIGFNLWSWKSIKKQDGTHHGALSFPQPKNWEMIIQYIKGEGVRPSYKESQEIFDELLEYSKFQYCIDTPNMHRYSQKLQGITLPAAGYDSYGKRGQSFSGGWEFGNVYGYRTEDETKLVVKPNGKLPALIPIEPNQEKPLEELWVELEEGGFVNYTIYRITSPSEVIIKAKGVTETILTITCGNQAADIAIHKSENEVDYKGFTLAPGAAHTIQCKVKQGIAQLASISFSL